MAGVLLALLIGVAIIEVARVLAVGRRSVRLNRAMHELRRPLQSLSLALGGGSSALDCARASLEQVHGALAELEGAVNGQEARRPLRAIALAEVVDSLERRWRWADVKVDSPDPDVVLTADPIGLGAALDNLVANALHHGQGPVEVRALTSARAARLEVRDGGSRCPDEPVVGDPRHGHGLPVAAAVAARHEGTLIPPSRHAGGGTVAALSLPALRPERPS